MTIILLEIEKNWVVRNLLIDKKLEKQIKGYIKEVKRNFINIKIDYQGKWYTCFIIKNRMVYIYLDDATEKSGISFFLNDLYFDHLVHIK